MDSEIEERARGRFDGVAFALGIAAAIAAAGLAFVLGLAAATASIWLLAAVVWGTSVSFAGHALVVAVLVAALAGIIALVRRCGVSPAWPILGFVIFLLFIAWFALSWSNGTGTLTPDIDT